MKKFSFYFTIIILCLGCTNLQGGWAEDKAQRTSILLRTEEILPIKNHKIILRTNSRTDSVVTDSLGKAIFNYLINISDSNIESAFFTPIETTNLASTKILELNAHINPDDKIEYHLYMDSLVTYQIHLKRASSDLVKCKIKVFSEKSSNINVEKKFITFTHDIGKIDTIISFKAYKNAPFTIDASIYNDNGKYERIIGKASEIADKNRLIKTWFKL